ncbi:MAG: hypothetical protein K2V38_24915, partial [Gemmataceae bacterium]|nr:hypothetical protein [Gemmataceae bacterium]
VRGEEAWVEELNDASRRFARELISATPDEVNHALRQFAALFPNVRPVATGHVGISCGSCVERGGDPEIAGPALLDLLPRLLSTVVAFYRLCRERIEADPEIAAEVARRAAGDAEYDLDQYIADESWDELAQRFGPFIYKHHPAAVLAHMGLRFYSLGVIAHLSRSKRLRAVARTRPELLERSEAENAASGSGSFLTDILRVLDDELLVVLHPGERKGFEVRISGVADNFQLHTLLAGELIGPDRLSGKKPNAAVVAIARGAAEPSIGLSAKGSFNLWNWTGLRPDGTLPTGQTEGSDHWVWNEGTPADIRLFEGVRVVLLGPPPYDRGWNAGRRFAHLTAELTVERTLTAGQVSDWLERLASAPRGSA